MGQAGSAYLRDVGGFSLLPNGRRRHPYALHSAAKRGDLEEVFYLLKSRAPADFCNEMGCTALHYAAREGGGEITGALMAAGASLAPANALGSTPLHWAADEGHAHIVGKLCAAGASPNLTTQVHNTPMHLAAKKGHAEVIGVLLEHSGSFSVCNKERRIPLHLAARYGHFASVEVLLEADSATVNVTDKDGRTALHLAALGGHRDTVQLLLDMDADKDARDRTGRTPVDMADFIGLELFGSRNGSPVKPAQGPGALAHDACTSKATDHGELTGAAAELMRRLDPRLAHLITPGALAALNQPESQPGWTQDLIEEDGEPLFATLSGVSLQFDWEEVRWERPVDHLLRQSLRESMADPAVVAAVNSMMPAKPGTTARVRTGGSGDLSARRPAYRVMSTKELLTVTNSFAPGNILGEGGFGPVFRGRLDSGMDVAVKVLDSSGLQGVSQFRCEIKVLSRVRHPHVVKLVGSCPDRGALVYELLTAGSLEDRLACKDGADPLPWQSRLCIAYEMACGLLYLHNCKPEAIIHRDFKPANILLDDYHSVKLGDVGLARLVPEALESMARSHVQDSCPVGTFQYIDPEYMRTGQLSPKSDVFSLGITLLQLLTGLPPNSVIDEVEDAVQKGNLASILDRKAGDWPQEAADMLARVGLAAAEMRRRRRPDLEVEILPVLRSLRNGILEAQLGFVLSRARDMQTRLGRRPPPPVHFLCPISQDLLRDPVVASDGFVYDRENLLRWLEESDMSPMTNLRLEDTSIMAPAPVLRQAIDEWLTATASAATVVC